ncbi:MAG TPA: polysaccharide biosynthesis protein, partial [Chromatiales bacterium]|nr:polysaccharide biosynthesis protein [Chromatiales bacterium]
MTAQGLCRRLIVLPRGYKQVVAMSVDSLALCGTLLAAIWLVSDRFSADVIAGHWHFPLVMLFGVLLFAQAGFYRTIIRFAGNRMLFSAFWRLALLAGVMAAISAWLPWPGFRLDAAVLPVFIALSLLVLVGSRLLVRSLLLASQSGSTRVIVYGAGHAGVRLLAALAQTGQFQPVAIIDDDPIHQGRVMDGVRIWPASELPRLIRDYRVDRVLLAMPSVARARQQEIIESLMKLNVSVQTVPDVSDIITGKARVDDLREVSALDVLGREPIPPDQDLLAQCIRHKSVLVTGAGGSIGSELCRQIIHLAPRRLVLLEISEVALYQIERELRDAVARQHLDVELVPLLGSIHHRGRMQALMESCHIQTVYHAAAYKHVPIVEHNMLEAIYNNAIGTWYAAVAAEQAKVEAFILISTDKAVMPVNVMGATKRLAELVLQGMARRGSDTRFCMVRFGNVLESSGSVVPLFREQIRRGGPVTVTDPDVIRYFMTIPEAAQLVIQASTMGRGGDVFLLDMGEPVRIVDLARRMIHLMGLSVRDEANPSGDISIEYTGLRPGEKLREELL